MVIIQRSAQNSYIVIVMGSPIAVKPKNPFTIGRMTNCHYRLVLLIFFSSTTRQVLGVFFRHSAQSQPRYGFTRGGDTAPMAISFLDSGKASLCVLPFSEWQGVYVKAPCPVNQVTDEYPTLDSHKVLFIVNLISDIDVRQVIADQFNLYNFQLIERSN